MKGVLNLSKLRLKTLFLILILGFSLFSYGQEYTKIGSQGDYRKNWVLIEKDGLLGFVDIKGIEIVKPQYDKISKFGDYRKNWALVKKRGLIGFINKDGIEIVNPKYDNVSKFGDYHKNWALVEKDSLFGFIDKNGFEIVRLKYDKIEDVNFIKGVQNLVLDTIISE